MLISCDVIKAEKCFFDWFQDKTFFSFVEFQMNKTLDLIFQVHNALCVCFKVLAGLSIPYER